MTSHVRSRRILAVTASVLVAAAGLVGCKTTTADSAAPGSVSDTITIGTLVGPTSLDPQTGQSGADYQWLDFVFARLITYNSQTGALEPGLATAWTWSADKKHLDVTLRPGVRFQDGTPLDASAVVYTLQRYMQKGDISNNLQFMTNARVVSADKVEITLSQPNAQLVYGLADRAGMILSPTAVKQEGDGFATHPVGAGPYSFASEVPNSSYNFTSYAGYYLDSQTRRVKNVKVELFQTGTAMATAMQTGDIQVATNVPTQVLPPLRKNAKLTTVIGQGSTPVIVWLDGKLKPMDNPKVRLAFSLALDRQAIMKVATDGLGEVTTELAPKGTVGYVPSAEPLWPVHGDPAKAKQLLAEAGYPNGVSFSCYNYPGIGYDITDPIIESQEAAVGIHVKVLNGAAPQSDAFFKGKSGPCLMSAYAGTPNPAEITEGILWSKSFYDAQSADFGVDQYIDQINTTYDQSALNTLYSKIWSVQKTNPGAIPMYTGAEVNVYQSNVKGWVNSPIQQEHWFGMYYTNS
jgi:ABC-type transport system substrate-binding protein